MYPAYPTKPIGPAATTAAATPTVFNLSAVDFSLNLSTLFLISFIALDPVSFTELITALPVSVLSKYLDTTKAAPTGFSIFMASLSLS